MGWVRRRLRKRSVSAPAALAVFERLEERLALRTPNDSFMKPAFRPGMPLNPQWNMELIQALKAWDLFSGNKRNVVAVMDYGIDFAHEDFGSTLTVQGNLWDRSRVFADYARRGYDEVNGPWNPITRPQPEGQTKPLPGEFQGNHAAGIIGALGLMVWLAVRWSLAVPITLAERRMAFFDSFRLTRGRFWPLLGMAILAGIMAMVIGLLSLVVVAPLTLMSSMTAFGGMSGTDPAAMFEAYRTFNPWMLVSAVINAAVYALTVGVVYAPFSAAWRDLKG